MISFFGFLSYREIEKKFSFDYVLKLEKFQHYNLITVPKILERKFKALTFFFICENRLVFFMLRDSSEEAVTTFFIQKYHLKQSIVL